MTSPDDTKGNALIQRPGTGLTKNRSGGIVPRMVGEALEVARRQTPPFTKQKFKVGEFELCEPDYRQVLWWAKALDREPEDVLAELAELTCWSDYAGITFKFRVEDGVIKELVWDGDQLPIEAFEWEEGLQIEVLGITQRMPNWNASQKLPSLRRLGVLELEDLWELILLPVPGLTELVCVANRLTKLDLSPVPGLTKLNCSGNFLKWLDLSLVPGLTELDCCESGLTELDLSPVPGLVELHCNFNGLTELDLSPVAELARLACASNDLEWLDLSPVPELTWLVCCGNRLTELDLSPVPGMVWLNCSQNELIELDLRPLDNPNIKIRCDDDVHIFR